MFRYIILEAFSALVGAVAIIFLLVYFLKKTSFKGKIQKKEILIPILVFAIVFFTGMFANKTYPPHFAMPAWMHAHVPGGPTPALPLLKIFEFFNEARKFEKIKDIGANPNDVPPPLRRSESTLVKIDLVAQEVIAEVGENIYFNYWTYNKQVPGPMFRVREGDTIELTLTNHSSSLHPHNIDLHAVNGPGGGAAVTLVNPGESKTFQWRALNPGLYIYHCATPNVSTHNAHGQYGLILVEPKEGLPEVDKEFYIVQGELYTIGGTGKKGLVAFDANALMSGVPSYVTFNGRLETTSRMSAKVGDRVRIYAGNGGVNLVSSFHPIGEIFDLVYPEAAIGKDSAIFKNVQTTIIPAGGATIVEFEVQVPGKIVLVDHALARMNKGAWAVIDVSGEPNLDIFEPLIDDGKESYGGYRL